MVMMGSELSHGLQVEFDLTCTIKVDENSFLGSPVERFCQKV